MKTKVALLDWDGTIASGFSLFRYVKMLVDNNIIENKVQENMLKLLDDFHKSIISYDDLTEHVPKVYSEGLKNCRQSQIFNLMTHFVDKDKEYFLPHAQLLFSKLKELDIKPITVTGAPVELIYQYQERFNIKDIYALEAEFINDVGTGNVKRNPSKLSNKDKMVKLLKQNPDFNVVLSAGDSTSDVPLFMQTPNNIIVNNPDLMSKYPGHEHNVLNLSTDNFDETVLIDFLDNMI